MNKKTNQQYRFHIPLAMLYITIALITIVLIYKIIYLFGNYYVSAATVIIPFWYALADLIAEVYGYNIARNVIWSGIISETVFIFVITFMLNLPSPSFWHAQAAYDSVLGHLPRILVGSVVAILLGSFINVYVLTKWKILLKGRMFWVRTIGSSIIGEGVFTVVVFTIEFIGMYPLHKIVELIVFSYLIKILFQPIAATPMAILAALLKRAEKVDVSDIHTNFNPFRVYQDQTKGG